MKNLLITALLMLTVSTANAQIKGKVLDGANDETPLSGVNVVSLMTRNYAVTDEDGSYAINVEIGDTLEFSFMGYVTQKIAVTDNRDIIVVLQADNVFIDEIVVVGYGVQKKSDVTGSVASFDNKTLQERPRANVIEALQGAVAGLNISMTGSNAEGSSSTTTIRGGNSITASNKPLVILDGVPFDGSWSEINPNDVESIEVLKDASFAAIYGARGANGVILIQTKKGSEERVSVSYDGYVAFSSAVNIPKMMDGETFYNRKIEAGGSITLTEQKMHDAGTWTNWLDLALRDGFRHQHNLSLRGKSKTTSYYLSANISDNTGISINDKFTRYSFRANIEQEIGKWVKFGTNTNFGYFDRSGNEANFSKAYLMNPLGQAYEEDGSLRLQTWEDNNYSNNPLSALNDVNKDITRSIVSNNYLEVTFPIKGLSYKLNTGYTFRTRLEQNYQGRNTCDGNTYNGVLSIDNTFTQNWLIENILSYTRSFGKHNIFLTALYSSQSEDQETNEISAKDFPNDIMIYYQPDKASSTSTYASKTTANHISQMFRANYSYDSRYLFTFTVRRDGFSAFGNDRKYGTFPSVAIGWNLNNEPFLSESGFSELFNTFKIRLSWGKNGNEAISAYSSLPNLLSKNYLTDALAPAFGFYPSKLASPLLGWETTTSSNIGLDFALLKDRIKGTLDVYFTNTSDLLLNRTIPSINGTSYLLENIGKTKGNGIEFQISSVNIDRKKFSWRTDFNIVRSHTELVDVGLYDENGKPIDDIASEWFIGYPVDVNYDYVFDGIYQVGQVPENAPFNSQPGYIRYKDINDDGDITPEEDKDIIGSTEPLFTAGMNNTFTYGNLSLSIFINGSVGVTAPNYLLSVHTLSYRENQLDKEFWSEDNPINTYPANVLDGSVNPARMYFYRKADFRCIIVFLLIINSLYLKR